VGPNGPLLMKVMKLITSVNINRRRFSGAAKNWPAARSVSLA
jgi:hypothetical protein